MRVLPLLAVLICVGFAAARIDILQLDTFDSIGDDNSCTITVNVTNQKFPLVSTSIFSTGDPNSGVILGGERDLQLTAKSGGQFALFSSDVAFGEWSLSTPPKASSTGLLQYDGIDGSLNLNIKGFEAITGSSGGYDLTIQSQANGIHVTLVTDLDTQYTFNIYDVNGGKSSLVTTLPGSVNDKPVDSQLLFSTFKGNVNFNKVGAIEISIEGFDNVDTATSLFALSGPEASATPSGSKSPKVASASKSAKAPSSEPSTVVKKSQSSTRTPHVASNSRTPSSLPSASPYPTCNCNCPTFRCGVVFDRPNTDDDDISSNSEGVVYRPIFYYAQDDDFDGIEGGRESTWVILSGKVAAFQEGVDDVGVYLYQSDANTIYTSIALVLISVLALVF